MADSIGGISYGLPVDILSDAVKGAGMEHEQIANNIANVDTPNFRRSTVSFQDALVDALGTPADPSQLQMKTDDDRQFEIGGPTPPQKFDPKPEVDESTQARVDKSNVDIDQETAELSSNSGYQQTMSALLQAQYKRLRQAITEATS